MRGLFCTYLDRTIPFPAELMTAYPVTPKMNPKSSNGPDAITPLEAAAVT